MKLFIHIVFMIIVLLVRSFATPQEDEFVKHFGNDPHNTKTWPDMKTYYEDPRHIKLKKFVAGAQKKLSTTWETANFDVVEPVYKKGKLKFQSSFYQPMRLEVLGYKIHVKLASKQVLSALNTSDNDRWFMTLGLKKDCVYFLKSLEPEADKWEFNLDKQVCGMRVKF